MMLAHIGPTKCFKYADVGHKRPACLVSTVNGPLADVASGEQLTAAAPTEDVPAGESQQRSI